MGGLARILKAYGKMSVTANGNKQVWVYDYVNDKPRLESEMTKEEIMASEKKKLDVLKSQTPPPKNFFGKQNPRDWTEDFSHENGNYQNNCVYCKEDFMGHKRRFVCKVCTEIKVNENKNLF